MRMDRPVKGKVDSAIGMVVALMVPVPAALPDAVALMAQVGLPDVAALTAQADLPDVAAEDAAAPADVSAASYRNSR